MRRVYLGERKKSGASEGSNIKGMSAGTDRQEEGGAGGWGDGERRRKKEEEETLEFSSLLYFCCLSGTL